LYAGSRFNDHLPELIGLKTKILGAVAPCLTGADFEKVDRFKNHLINHPDFRNKLILFDKLSHEYTVDNFTSKTVETNEARRLDAVVRFRSIDKLSFDIMKEIDPNVKSLLPIASLMLVLVGVRETISYLNSDILKATAAKLGLDGYDIEEICSLGSKVSRGSGYVTDVTAIRDCISHSHYEITLVDGDYSIAFSWQQAGGYNFRRTFTRLEFFKFFYDYWFFEKLQSIILLMNVFDHVFKTHLMRRNLPK
jgi:hypothetical protein